MKKNLYLLIITFLYHYGSAQTLGQDAQGYSSIVVPSTTFNLDITNNVGTFSLYQDFARTEPEDNVPQLLSCRFEKDAENCLSDIIGKSYPKQKFFTWGVDLKGAVKDGFGTLFSNENVASSASLGGMIGYNIAHTSYKKKAAQSIAAACRIQNDADNAITKKIKEIPQKLLLDVSLQTGMTPKALTPPEVSINIDEQINYYNSRIERLQNEKNTVSLNADKIEVLNKKITNLEALLFNFNSVNIAFHMIEANKQAIDSIEKEIEKSEKKLIISNISEQDAETAKNEITELRRKKESISAPAKDSIYSIYYSLKNLLQYEYPSESFNDLFGKSDWDLKRKKIEKDLFLAKGEKAKIEKLNSGTNEIKELISTYQSLLKLAYDKRKIEDDHVNKVINRNIFYVRHLIYIRGSTKGSDYRYDLANDSTMVSERFPERHFNGYDIESGYTVNFLKYNFIGISTSLNYLNNIYALTTTTYKLEKSDSSITEGSFKTSEEIKALSGNYDAFLRYDFNFDFVHLFHLKENPAHTDGKTSILYISLNPYIRHRIYDKSDTLKNNTVLGLGLHTYNSRDNKIMGGLFIQTNDLFGVHTGNNSSLGKRISFGIIAKYAITGLKLDKG